MSTNFHFAPTIETEHLRLRSWHSTDMDSFTEMMQDSSSAHFLFGTPNVTVTDAWRAFATMVGHWQLRAFGEWAISDKISDDLIGRVGFWMPDGAEHLELGWCIHPGWRGRGLAGIAARLALDNMPPNVVAVGSLIHLENLASRSIARRLGGQKEGAIGGLELWRYCTGRSGSV